MKTAEEMVDAWMEDPSYDIYQLLKDYASQAIDRCAEKAKVVYEDSKVDVGIVDEHLINRRTFRVDKSLILSVKDELK